MANFTVPDFENPLFPADVTSSLVTAVGSALPATFGTPRVIVRANGFTTTQFGIPSYELRASGFLSPSFSTGAVARTVNMASSLGLVTVFGPVYAPTIQTVAAIGAQLIVFGDFVWGWKGNAPALQGGRASSMRPVVFGAPSGGVAQAVDAEGALFTSFGDAIAGLENYAEGFVATQFGGHTIVSDGDTSGFLATVFGTPLAGGTYAASGMMRTRLGRPRGRIGGTQPAYGWFVTRFGYPSAKHGSLNSAGGWVIGTFGLPNVLIAHKARMSGSATRFGRPTVRRNPLC